MRCTILEVCKVKFKRKLRLVGALLGLITAFHSLALVSFYSLFGVTVNELVLAIKEPSSLSFFNLTPLPSFVFFSLFQIFLGVVAALLIPLSNTLRQKTTNLYQDQLRSRLLKRISHLPFLEKYQRLTNPDLLSLILKDTKNLSTGLINNSLSLLSSLLNSLLALFYLHLYH